MSQTFVSFAALFWCLTAVTSFSAPSAAELFTGPGYKKSTPLARLAGGTGWSGPWAAPDQGALVEEPGAIISGVMKSPLHTTLAAGTADVQAYRNLTASQGADGTTVWLSFILKKDAGARFLGLSLFQDNAERLFIGTPNGSDSLRLGPSAMTTTSAAKPRLLVVRIDFRPGRDIAYLFINPNLASVPDTESAVATMEGDFSFNRLRLAAGGGNAPAKGSFDQILLGSAFADVVRPDGSGTATAGSATPMPVLSWEKRPDALWITTAQGMLRLQPMQDGTVRVQFGTEAGIAATKSFVVENAPAPVTWSVRETPTSINLESDRFTVAVSRATSQLSLRDAMGKVLIQEPQGGGRPSATSPEFSIQNQFKLTSTEGLYGLGQFRDGCLNLRGRSRELVQFNTQAAVPVLISTNGWGMFWDNPSRTVFSDNGGGMTLASDEGQAIDYYLFVGKTLDDILAQYRGLTGSAPMPPRWALGYHQSRNRYASQQELLGVAEKMRTEHIPVDSIFLDYQYWGPNGVGSHLFDTGKYPNPAEMVRELHAENLKLVISVWPAIRARTANYDALDKAGFLLNGVNELGGTIYDPFNPGAADMYWQQIAKNLLPLGIDGWFLDGPEPEGMSDFAGTKTFAGPGALVRNLYPFAHTANVYHGLLAAQPNQRPYIITRCAWAAQQRNGTVVWSGDIGSSFAELQKQIPAGLNFVATGIPYWTTDIGGYSGGSPSDPAYRETYIRWWQYGTFCPIFRSHGRRAPGDTTGPNELWAFGPDVQTICQSFDDLRYRLLPYIYTLSGHVTQDNYTPMRLLAFDFPKDQAVFNLKDEFMYGPALLVCPVTTAGATSRKVYLPAGCGWTDFWTGERFPGGQAITAPAPLTRMPLYVRDGSLLPLGPKVQYASENPSAPIELRIYPGADGTYTLYDDDGETQGYTLGEYSLTPMAWDDKEHTLTIGATQKSFPNMQKSRTFRVVLVDAKQGLGIEETPSATEVIYSGTPVTVKLPR
jgi:alpha-D-xyloside xylohydrolase